MDINIFNEFRINKILTDVQLIIKDDENEPIMLHLHKIILANYSKYFRDLFINNFKENGQNEITIIVPNIYAIHDIIMSFYGQKTNIASYPEWYYQLKIIECRDFLLLDYDLSIINNLKIPDEGFDLVLEILYKLTRCFNDEKMQKHEYGLIRLINKHLPIKYDLSYFSDIIINNMIEASKMKLGLCIVSNNMIQLYDIENDKLTNTDINIKYINILKISPNKKYIIILIEHSIIQIWDAINFKLINTIYDDAMWPDAIICMTITHDNKYIITGYRDSYLKIYHIMDNKCIRKLIGHTCRIQSIEISSDDKYIISSSKDRTIKIWNFYNGELINTLIGHTNWIRTIAITTDNKYIISGSDDWNIIIWKFDNTKVATLSEHKRYITKILITSDNKKFISVDAANHINIWDIETQTLLKNIEYVKLIVDIDLSFDDKIVIVDNLDSIQIIDIDNKIIKRKCCMNNIYMAKFIVLYDEFKKIINNLSEDHKIKFTNLLN